MSKIHNGAMPASGGDDRTGDYVGYDLPYEHEHNERRVEPTAKPTKTHARTEQRGRRARSS